MASYEPNPEANFSNAQNHSDNQANQNQPANTAGRDETGEKIIAVVKTPSFLVRLSCWLLSLIAWACLVNYGWWHSGMSYYAATFLIAWLVHSFLIIYFLVTVCAPSLTAPKSYILIIDFFFFCFTVSGFIVGLITMIAKSLDLGAYVAGTIFAVFYLVVDAYLAYVAYRYYKS